MEPPSTLPPDWRDWPLEAKLRLRDRLREKVRGDWRDQAREDQLPPAGEWTTLLLRGGRGSGKSWAGAHILADLIRTDPARESEGPGQWAIIAPTYGDVRDVCVEGESGLLAALGTTRTQVDAGQSSLVKTYNRSMGEVVLRDGSIVFMDGADDGALRIQGKNLRGAWCDEIGLWKRWATAWDESLGYALRKGQARVVATGTPKRSMPARRLIKRLLADPNVVSRRLRTYDNLRNLSQAFLERVKRHEGTELGRQELEGELLDEVEGAMWRSDWIEHVEHGPVFYQSKVCALDPADGLEDGAEQGLAVAGIGSDWLMYLEHSDGLRLSPLEFCKHAVLTALERDCSRLVVEKNHGAGFLVDLLEQAMRILGRRIAVQVITASRNKRERAEPVAATYEQGKWRHIGVGDHTELEEQMTTFTGAVGEPSPDRLDALVHAAHELMGLNWHGPPDPDVGEGAVPYTDRSPEHLGGAVAWT